MAFSYLAHGADPQPYRMEIASTGNGDMDATLKSTSDLQTLRTSAPVSPFGLIARARGEIDRLTTVLESYGYYQGGVTVKINGLALQDSVLRDTLAALPNGTEAKVELSFTLGPLYHLRKIDIDGELPDSARAALGIQPGSAAVASDVLAGGARLLTALQEQGYAFAKVDAPVAYEAADEPALDVSFHATAGPRVDIGEIHIEGHKRTHEALLRRALRVHTGELYRPSVVEQGRRDLLALGVFSQVTVQVGDAVDGTGGVPVTFKVRERLRHAATLNAAYSTDLGGSGGVTWTERNLFGNAEQLTLKASALGIKGSDTSGLGYDVNATLTKPDFLRRDQSLQVSVGALKQSLQAYDQKAITSAITLIRKLSSVWSVSGGLKTVDESIIQPVEDVIDEMTGEVLVPKTTYYYTLVAIPLVLSYDSTNLSSPLEDPRHGYRGSLSVTPTIAIGHPNTTFIIEQIQIAGYWDLKGLLGSAPGRSVLTARGLAGIAKGADQFSLPPDQRFYGGGSGTIRGYRYQSVGPVFEGTQDPIGGTEIEAATIEFRQRFGENFGAAAFVDGGAVDAGKSSVPNGSAVPAGTSGGANDFRIGVGLGLRYYTPIGPIRFDIAVPTKRRMGDESFQVYIGIGQAY
jgi:translocation and assembly module TamA